MPSTISEELAQEITAQADQFDTIMTQPEPYDALYEAPLEVVVRRQLAIVLCTGGPHVEAVADLYDDGTVSAAHLFGCWGIDQETRPVPQGSGLWRALEEYAESALVR